MELDALGLVIYTFGNVSAVDRKNGVFAIRSSCIGGAQGISAVR